MGLEGSGAFGAVGIGAWTWAVLSGIPEGACACGAEGHMASIGPPALGAKGCVERLRPTGKTTHYDLCVAGAPANHVRSASLRSGGCRLAVRKMIEYQIGALPRTPFPASRDFAPVGSMSLDSRVVGLPYESSSFATSRGNERYEGKKQRVIYFRYHFGVFPLWWLAPPPFRPAGKRVTGFSVAYGSLRIQFPCHLKRGHYGCLAMGPCLCRKA